MTIYEGTAGNDRLKAQSNSDDIAEVYGLAGNDLLETYLFSENFLYGGDGDDTLSGSGAEGNHFHGGSGDDHLEILYYTADGINELFGDGGSDFLDARYGPETAEIRLDGGKGSDTMYGHDGRDIFRVNSVTDVISESFVQDFDNLANPHDEVRASLDWTLAARFEDLTLLGTKDINGTGNGDSNYMTGNEGANVLDGGRGKDSLDGEIGADTLIGGESSDTFYIRDASATVIENLDEGTDKVFASVSFNMARNVERIELTGEAISTVGNKLANRITGNELDNSLMGAAGGDTIFGRGGNDTIRGDEDADVLIGGLDKDRLSGGVGADTFVFEKASESRAGSTRDLISDFQVDDRIDLSKIGMESGHFFTFVAEGLFSGIIGELIFSDGSLLGDTSGDGVADFEVRLVGVTQIDADSLIL